MIIDNGRFKVSGLAPGAGSGERLHIFVQQPAYIDRLSVASIPAIVPCVLLRATATGRQES